MGSKAQRRALREKRRKVNERRAGRASFAPTFGEHVADSVGYSAKSLSKSARTMLGR